jgi:hypothetical protein
MPTSSQKMPPQVSLPLLRDPSEAAASLGGMDLSVFGLLSLQLPILDSMLL